MVLLWCHNGDIFRGDIMVLALLSSDKILIDNIGYYIPKNTSQIICGDNTPMDNKIINYAHINNIDLISLPLTSEKINNSIIYSADKIIFFLDKTDINLKHLINLSKANNKNHLIVYVI